jgi:hypothetical protein
MQSKAVFLAVALSLPVSAAAKSTVLPHGPVVKATPLTEGRLRQTIDTAVAKSAAHPVGPVVEAASLTEEQLRQAIIGKVIYLNLSGLGLLIHYRVDGRMTGSMDHVASPSRANGSRDSGRWWLEANQLCQRWASWMDEQTNCYNITRQDNLIIWVRQDGVSGIALIEE